MGATLFLSVLAALMYPFPSLQSLLPPGEGTVGAALLLLRLLSPGDGSPLLYLVVWTLTRPFSLVRCPTF